MKVLLVSLECEGKTVSGNGTYASCVRRALISTGHHVVVVCGRPAAADEGERKGNAEAGGKGNGISAGDGVLFVPCSKWGKLDRDSSWEEFAAKSASIHGLAIASFEPDVAINVDWTGSRALVALTALLTIKPRVIHLNFRVFFLSDGVPLKGEDAEFYMSAEAEAMQAAKMCVALNKCDMGAMLSLDPDKKHDVRVLSPPLRKDIALGAMKEGAASWNGSAARTLILFCGRISREKNVLAFVEACENAGLSDIGCAPAIVGHAADGDEYAQECLERVRKMPGAEVYGFLSAPQLSKVFGRCRLLLHPAHYEAWGMVIAEAAAYGVPAIVHSPNAQSECMVGVCELLPIGDATIGFDFTKDGTMTGKELKSIAKNVDRLEALSKRARQLSLAWDEAAHARRIDDLVKELFSAD